MPPATERSDRDPGAVRTGEPDSLVGDARGAISAAGTVVAAGEHATPVTADSTSSGERSGVVSSAAGADGSRDRIDPDDEGLLEGWTRRLRELVVDLGKPGQGGPLWTMIAFVGLMIYAYWPGLLNAHASWSNAQYSHGWLVPVFSVGMLIWWRRPLGPVTPSARVAGLAMLAAAFAIRLAAAWFRIVTIDMYTFVPAVAGAFLLSCGWSSMRWAWSPIAFLIFMFPLPDEATRYLLGPLQTLATTVSTFALQTFGLEAFQEGNQIVIGEMHLGVVDACSGLRMLTIFIALSVALVMLGDRPWWENVIILGSAIPIALIVNSIRITVTGMLYQIATSDIAEMVFHDLAGWFMMPMALAMLYGEQYLLAKLVVADDVDDGAGAIGLQRSVTIAPARVAQERPALLPLSTASPAPSATPGVARGSPAARGRRGAGAPADASQPPPSSRGDREMVRRRHDGLLPGI